MHCQLPTSKALTNNQSYFSVLHAIIFPLLYKLPSTDSHHLIVIYPPPKKIMNDIPPTLLPPLPPLPPLPTLLQWVMRLVMGKAQARRAKLEPQVRSMSREGKARAKAQAARAKPKPQSGSVSGEGKARAARAKPVLRACSTSRRAKPKLQGQSPSRKLIARASRAKPKP